MKPSAKKSTLLKGKKLRTPFVVTVAAALPAAFTAAIPACGTTKPPFAEGNPTGAPGLLEGPCAPDGRTQACHKTIGQHQGFIDCFSGTQTCMGGVWSDCGNGEISSHYAPNLPLVPVTNNTSGSGSIHALGVNPPPVDSGTSGSLCASDPCNPYCMSFNATPDSGTIQPIPSVPDVPPNGQAVCSGGGPGGFTFVGTSCATCSKGAATLNQCCAQDTHCDTGSSTCQWNIVWSGGSDYTDSTCGSFDLTVNAFCPAASNPPPVANFTVCNRGTQVLDAPAGTTTKLNIFLDNPSGPSAPSSNCTAPPVAPSSTKTSSLYSSTLASPLAAGACTQVADPGINGLRHAYVYATRSLTGNATSGNGANPITYTTTNPHGLNTGDGVTITGVTGNTNANVTNQAITVTGASSFTVAATGNGAPGGTASIAAVLGECSGAGQGSCFNNESDGKDNGSCGSCGNAGGSPVTVTPGAYHALCSDPQTHVLWTYLTYDITAGSGDVSFKIKTAPDVSGSPGTYTSFYTVADPPNGGDPWSRPLSNAVDLNAALNGPPAATNEWLQIQITDTPSGNNPPYPVLNSWALEYSCVPNL
jgi:hypothetical protein